MSKTYRGYELVQAIAEGEIKNGSKFIFRYKDDYEENAFWNGENICYIDKHGYLLKDISDCELIYGTFELIEDEEMDIQAIEEYEFPVHVITNVIENELLKLINENRRALKQLDKRTRKEKE